MNRLLFSFATLALLAGVSACSSNPSGDSRQTTGAVVATPPTGSTSNLGTPAPTNPLGAASTGAPVSTAGAAAPPVASGVGTGTAGTSSSMQAAQGWAGTGPAVPPPPPPPAAGTAAPPPPPPAAGTGAGTAGSSASGGTAADMFCDKYGMYCGYGMPMRHADRAACLADFNSNPLQQGCKIMHLDTAIAGTAAACNGMPSDFCFAIHCLHAAGLPDPTGTTYCK